MNFALVAWKSTDFTGPTITNPVNARLLGAYRASLPPGLP